MDSFHGNDRVTSAVTLFFELPFKGKINDIEKISIYPVKLFFRSVLDLKRNPCAKKRFFFKISFVTNPEKVNISV